MTFHKQFHCFTLITFSLPCFSLRGNGSFLCPLLLAEMCLFVICKFLFLFFGLMSFLMQWLKCVSFHAHQPGERPVDRITDGRERAPLCETMRIGLTGSKCSLTLGSDMQTSWTSSCHLANPASLFAIHMAQCRQRWGVFSLLSPSQFLFFFSHIFGVNLYYNNRLFLGFWLTDFIFFFEYQEMGYDKTHDIPQKERTQRTQCRVRHRI